MIVVLGRPRVYRAAPDGELAPGGLAAEIALALARSGAAVELVGSIGDDPDGDRLVVALGRAGVGHAALLRDPAARTPQRGIDDEGRPLPRLEADDVELGLRYLPEYRVLVIAEALDADARRSALEAAEYGATAVVLVAEAGEVAGGEGAVAAGEGAVATAAMGERVTVLERAAVEDAEVDEAHGPATEDDQAFAALVADYALRLERAEDASAAFSAALIDGAWEQTPD